MITALTMQTLCMLPMVGSCAADANDRTVRIETGMAQMFVDDYLIDSQSGLERTIRQPRKDNGGNTPVIALDDEFGSYPGTQESNGTIVYDPVLKKYVMFALAYASSMRTSDRIRLYRFTSKDGMNWVKGDDGKPEWIKFNMTDEASGRVAMYHDIFSCYYDKKDKEYPYKGWLMISNWGDDLEGVFYVRSKDGHKWERLHQIVNCYAGGADPSHRELITDGVVLRGPGDATTFYYDEKTDRFLGLFKFFTEVDTPIGPGNRCRARAYQWVDGVDKPFDTARIPRIALKPTQAESNGDMPHDEYYDSMAWRYGSLWLGALRVWHGGGSYPYSPAGSTFLKLLVSRDGLNWKKVPFKNDSGHPEVFIPNGPEGGNNGKNDGGYISEFSQGPLRIGDELIYYYAASSWGKNNPADIRVTGGGIFRARLRVDGFVSVDAGTFTTKPLIFEGDELLVNAAGPVKVEVLNTNGTVLGSADVSGDSIRHKVQFDGKSMGSIANQQAVKLRFTVGSSGQLYSFTVK